MCMFCPGKMQINYRLRKCDAYTEEKKKIMVPERVNYWCLKSIFPYFLVRSDMSLNTQHQYQKWDFLEVVTETDIFFVIVFFLTEKKYKCSSGSQEKKFNPDSWKKKKNKQTNPNRENLTFNYACSKEDFERDCSGLTLTRCQQQKLYYV